MRPRISRPAWALIVRATLRGFVAHQLPDLAATLTYFAVLSLAPSLVAVMSLGAIFGQGRRSADALLATIDEVAPDSAIALLRVPLQQFVDSPSVGIALVVSILIAIWATSSYVGAFGRAMNRIYEIAEGRPLWKLKPYQILVALVVMVLALLTIAALVLSGPVSAGIGDVLGLGSTPRLVWSIIKWPVLVASVILIVAILYYVTPNAKQPKFRWMSVGAFGAVTVLVGVSLLFALYVKNFADFDRAYRSFAGVVIVLIWLWIANLTLLFGAEFDAQVARARQLEHGIRAEHGVQLPPRDTEVMERNARRQSRNLSDARRIRRASGKGPRFRWGPEK